MATKPTLPPSIWAENRPTLPSTTDSQWGQGFEYTSTTSGGKALTETFDYPLFKIDESLRWLRDLFDSNGRLTSDIAGFVGMVIYRTLSTTPTGRWIKANGFEVSRTAYADLFAEAEASDNYIDQATKDADPETYAGYYGDGDGSTTFTLPDLRSEFIRGFDDGRGVDSGRTFGGWQKGSFIPGDDNFNDQIISVYQSSNKKALGWDDFTGYDEVQADTVVATESMTLSPIGGLLGHGGASRPRNIAYIAWIRY